MQSDWIFGYGSILDDFKPSNHSSVFLCDLNHPSYKRCWNFRSATGFTAVGIEKKATPSNDKTGNTMCGVLFRIGTTGCSQHNDASFITQSTKSLAALDAREKGYKRVNINPKYFTLAPEATCVAPLPSFKENDRCWLYIPVNPQSATKDYPICQTYLDTILRGCLKWGKENLAQRWVKETIGWSRFYLNDAPLSRRPWLYRQFFCEIDGVLKQFSDRTFFFERRHPEEFSAKWLSTLVGFWGVPPRNPYFIGREHELEKIVDTFQKSETQHGRGHIGVTMIETVGLGGVGKTQVAAEYCYRHYFAESNKRAKDEMKKILGNKYSLIMWWRAESAEVLAFDVRRFAEDTGIVVHGVRNEEVVREVMCRLYQTTKPWLMVLDNLTDKATLDAYLPRGASSSGGHILVTSREFLSGFHNDNRVELRCFNMNESLDLLRKAGGEHLDIDVPYYEERENENHRWTSGNNNTKITKYVDMSSNNSVSFTAGQVLSQRLGHLPLALSVAAAYMRQCDVDVTSYLRILNSSGNGLSGERLPGYPMGVEDSLMLSLQRIRENEEDVNQLSNQNYCNDTVSSRDVLDTLCYLYPDDISKDIVSSIVGCLLLENNMIHSCVSSINFTKAKIPERTNSITRLLSGGIGGLCLAGLSYWYLMSAGKNTPVKSRQNLLGVTALVSATTIALFAIDSQLKMNRENANSLSHKNEQQNQKHRHPLILQNNKRESEATKKKKNHANICSNRIWLKLKKYSLLTVQRGHGSMHRLLQQLLRTTSDHDAVRSLATCIWSIKQLWSFDPADASTWKEAGNVVDHIKCVGNQVRMVLEKNEKIEKNEKNSNNVNNDILLVELQINTGTLLTESALYMSMALSRFREARDVLDLALQVQRSKTEIALLNGSNILQKRLSRGLAHTMHTAGKVSRYCGEYDTAHAFLTDALAIRGGRQKPSMDVAATLHELGVLMIKRGVWSEAQVLLEESLSMKRTISNNDQANIDNDKKECAPSSAARFSEEAATLHQLAVVAMNGKPRRLSKAEELLREALVVMKKGPFGVGGRAATLSKLAQVLERCGKHSDAEFYLIEALRLYQRTYGDDVPHVNIAAVLRNLGEHFFQAKQYRQAKSYLIQSFNMRQKLYGNSEVMNGVAGVAGIEIGLNLSRLGEVERAQLQWAKSYEYFERAGNIYLRLLTREYGGNIRSSGGSGGDTSCRVSGMYLLSLEMKEPPSLFEKRLFRLCSETWNWQLKAASNALIPKEEVQKVQNNLLKLKEILAKFDSCSKSNDSRDIIHFSSVNKKNLPRIQLSNHLIHCRSEVRKMIKSGIFKKNEDAIIKLQEMKLMANNLKIPSKTTDNMDGSKNKQFDELRHAATKFVSKIVMTIDQYLESRIREMDVKNILFSATDDIRAALRKSGVDVED